MKLKSSITRDYCSQTREDHMPFLTSLSSTSLYSDQKSNNHESSNLKNMKSCQHQRHHNFVWHFSHLAITAVCLLFSLVFLASVVSGKSTPEPPVFYDCEDEGFFPHPKDCRKYFWCLDSGPANLGIVPHAFTCPSGLYFSTKTEGCDYPSNVACANAPKNKTVLSRTRSRSGKKTTTTTSSPANDVEDDEIILTTLSATTTEAPTTLPSTTNKPSKGPERLLKEAGVTSSRNRRPQKQQSPQQQPASSSTTTSTSSATSTGDDNLKQLLQLVQSLGGVERIKTLVTEKESRLSSSSDASSNNHNNLPLKNLNDHENSGLSLSPSSSSRSHQRINSRLQSTPPPQLFSPSYETPRRPELPVTTTTETPYVSNNDNNVVRHRRPQSSGLSLATNLESDSLPSPAVTVNPFQSYADPSRGTSLAPQNSFVSRTPEHHINHYEDEHALNTEPLLANNNNQNSNLNQNNNNNNNNNFYSFSYNTPGSRVSYSGQTGPGSQSHSFVPLNDGNHKNKNHDSTLIDEGSHVTRPAPVSQPLTSSFGDAFFTYNTPGRLETSAPQSTTTATESTPFDRETEAPRRPEQNFARESNRIQSPRNEHQGSTGGFVRVRVNPSSSSNFRFPEGNPAPSNGGRRATRVRIANPSQINPGNLINHQPSSLSSQTLPPLRSSRLQGNHLNNHRNIPGNQPGVLYDEEAAAHHNAFPVTDTVPIDFITTRKPPRRRPPQREHLRNRQEANPVGALVNLPPPNLQIDPLPQVGGDRGLPRPFPPRPQNPPRILPIAVPLVNLPRDIRLPAMINQQDQSNRVTHQPQFSNSQPQLTGFTPPSDPNFRPGTVRYNDLGLSSPVNTLSSPRPNGFDDLFATDFPFFGDLPSTNIQNDNRDPEYPNTFSPNVFSSITTTTLSTTTTTTESPRSPPEPTTGAFGDVSTRRQRGRGRARQSTTAVTLPTNLNTTPRPMNRGRERSRIEVTTVRPTQRPTTPHVASAPAIDEEGASIPSGPAVEMDSGSVKCTRRGVFAHPGSCGQFVVCAPVSRGSLNYRSYLHHCPAEQVFVEEVGRCRPGNKERCEVFTK